MAHRKSSPTPNGRASPQAVEKRRAARQLNTLFSGPGPCFVDGRTSRRRVRLLRELKEGRGGKPLKAIEVVQRAHELLELGETLRTLRVNGVTAPRVEITKDTMKLAERTQAAYGFRPEAWRVLGIEFPAQSPPTVAELLRSNRARRHGSK